VTIADVLAILAALAIAGAGFPSLLVLTRLLLPASVARSESGLTCKPVRLVAFGFGAAVLVIAAASVASNTLAGPGKLLGLVILLCGLALSVLGATGLAARLARAAWGNADQPPSVRDLIRAAVLLELACALPVAGWFVVLPIAICASLGAGVSAALSRIPRPVAPATRRAVEADHGV
jgi:hypothetical protein